MSTTSPALSADKPVLSLIFWTNSSLITSPFVSKPSWFQLTACSLRQRTFPSGTGSDGAANDLADTKATKTPRTKARILQGFNPVTTFAPSGVRASRPLCYRIACGEARHQTQNDPHEEGQEKSSSVRRDLMGPRTSQSGADGTIP